MEQGKQLKVIIVGGGLVGSLSACYFGQRGHEVHLYEYRQDIRSTELVKGRSINLAMSARARAALRQVGLENVMLDHGIPMRARMIHGLDGSLREIPYDARGKECIYSVSRKYLNEVLLTAAEKFSNVKIHFEHKLVHTRLEAGLVTFKRQTEGDEVTEHADLVVGADGAYSAVRAVYMRRPMFNYSQTYIPHGYLELCIPPTQDGQFAMKPNYLHIWPRGSFMMIALPNQDHSWTVTLFMPFPQFAALDTPARLLNFFQKHFPDSIPLIGKDKLVKDFFAATASHLVSVKCEPYNLGSSAVLIGDAAHAMVPFYGQGMNCGFEDCKLLDKVLSDCGWDLTSALPQFSSLRSKDAQAICDLAMYNYIEMRDLVNRNSFLWRKRLDNVLYWLFPSTWVPLYNSVTFSEMSYSKCAKNKQWQDKIVGRGVKFFGLFVFAALIGCRLYWQRILPTDFYFLKSLILL
ncbi:kynurenine 3-monooxygenase [Macrosteles quadrilineatus]|uniref:kynurenine 3-monooxygenase n=1 Tax=Macrosteles quadrilineatus TaxID=74068 RepID=UPI0023E1A67A|nr:kynurenine 3-monooxygenase [Macrosteles quadrilineatus]